MGGNHDLTGKVLQDAWDERLGRRYYHFRYKDVLFLVLDTEDNTPERVQEIFEMRNHALQVAAEQGGSRTIAAISQYRQKLEAQAGSNPPAGVDRLIEGLRKIAGE